jgi:radical SAM superfamily enzyme YgiQ (UPF0313 family)
VVVYSQRVREAFANTPIVIGGIEASLRRIAHFDYWQEKIRRSILLDARADLLVFGNGERQIVEIAHRLAAGEAPAQIRNIRGTALLGSGAGDGWTEIDSTHLDTPGPVEKRPDPYAMEAEVAAASRSATAKEPGVNVVRFTRRVPTADRERSYIRLPSYEQVQADAVLYAHASRILHMESNPGNARALVQRHGQRDVCAERAAGAAHERRDGSNLRVAVRARPTPRLWRRQNPSLRDDSLFRDHPTRLFRRLHLLLDHGA